MGLVAAAAFTVSLIHFPLGGATVHLTLLGLLGVLLGPRSVLVVAATLLLQTLLLQHGGLLSLGINSLNMSLGALAAWGVWRLPSLPRRIAAVLAGFVGVMLPAVLVAAEFAWAGYGKGFFFVVGVYSVVAVVEAAVTWAAVDFLTRAKPEILAAAPTS